MPRPLLPLAERLLPYLRRIDANRIYTNFGPLALELSRRLTALFLLPNDSVVVAASGTAALIGAFLGSAGRAQPEDQRLRDMVKWFSPERAQDPSAVEGSIFSPHNLAGRLLMMRSETLAKAGAGDDRVLHEKFIAAGYETGIATAARHRHLSLLHVYDYPHYDYDRRDAYCQGPQSEAGPPPPAACP